MHHDNDFEQTILIDWNNRMAPLKSETLISLFKRVVACAPANKAILFHHHAISYLELDKRSDELAHHLTAFRGRRMAFLLERDERAVITMLAILKAGAAYVPVDPGYPDERLHYILKDAQASVLITTRQHAGRQQLTRELLLDRLPPTAIPPEPEPQPVLQEEIAYIMYTSGSTGEPKGVEVFHEGICRLVCHNDPVPVLPGDRVAQAGNLAFDASTYEIWGALLNGATLVMLPYETVIDSNALGKALETNRVTHAWFTVALFNQLAAANPAVFGGLRHLLVGGDALNPVTISAVLRSETPPEQIWNGYGPTENTTFTTLHPVTLDDCARRSVPIGKPVVNTCCYVLDEALRPVPVGVVGELYTSGHGLARGYLNKPDKTAEVFIDNPFYERSAVRGSTPATARMYRTGDRVRWLEDGSLEFMGRADSQIKIRGYRIEPGEVENQLLQLPQISQAVVTVNVRENEKQLVAYCVSEATPAELIQAFRARVPGYMVPSALNVLKKLPLTANGKVDKRRLPAAEYFDGEENSEPLQTETERQLARIWQEVLGREGIIGRDTHFFEIGGHSLLVVRVQHFIMQNMNKHPGIRLLFANPVLAQLARVLEEIPASEKVDAEIQRKGYLPDYPLSEAQLRLWFIEQTQQPSSLYHVTAGYRIQGDFDLSVFKKSMEQLQRRHQSLRTGIFLSEGKPRQKLISEPLSVSVLHIDDIAQLACYMQKEADVPFLFDGGLLWRVVVFCHHDNTCGVLFTFHHIIVDGWSMGNFYREFDAYYRHFSGEIPRPLFHDVMQYTDYCLWEEKQNYERGSRYWQARLDDVQPLTLPVTPALNKNITSTDSEDVRLEFNTELTTGLTKTAGRYHSGLLNLFCSGLSVLLSRYCGQSDIPVATVWANRPTKESEETIGMFVNTLIMRTWVDEKLTVHSFLTQNGQRMLNDLEYASVPLSRVLSAFGSGANSGGEHPLCSAMLVLQNTDGGDGKHAHLNGLDLLPVSLRAEPARFDICISITYSPEGCLCVNMNYRKSLWSVSFAERFLHEYQQIMQGMLLASTALHQLRTIEPEQERTLLCNVNQTKVAHNPTSVLKIWREQVARTPEASAIRYGSSSYSYQIIDKRSDELAHHLTAFRGRRMAFLLERDERAVVTMLAILKAGAAYVPVDPGYPDERLHYILKDAQASVLITTRQHAGRQQLTGELLLDRLPPTVTPPEPQPVLQEEVAYIMYTSGSTGEPKGVEVLHEGICRLVCHNDPVPVLPGDRVAQAGNLAFDASTYEIWGALLNGATLVMLPYETVIDSNALAKALETNRVTHAWFTVALFNQLAAANPAAFGGLRHLLVGGDALNPVTISAVLRSETPPDQIWNGYGPTENTTFTTLHPVTLDDCARRSIPIGKPVVNTCCYVLDEALRPVPVGVVGELYTSGHGLARGYLNKPDKTAEVFIDNPFYERSAVRGSTPATARMYRTGDRVRWQEDGSLEFMGRADSQIKIRGYRIEPGEVENQLLQLPQISQAVVTVNIREDEKQLVAYCVSEATPTELIQAFRARVPGYMVPSALNVLKKLPLTANGKVDKRRLPAAEYFDGEENSEPLQTETERQLARIWQEVLGREGGIGRDTHFFEIGGHSLLVVKMVSIIHSVFGRSINVSDIFKYATLSKLALYLDGYCVADNSDKLMMQSDIDSWTISEVVPVSVFTPANILLTGSTGFLGVHLLSRLMLDKTTEKVYCLIRADNELEGRERILAAAEKYNVFLDMNKLAVVPGDLSKPGLGISEELMAMIEKDLDSIYHCGAWVNHLHSYSALRPTNVESTKNLLSLCTKGKGKRFFYISTLSAASVQGDTIKERVVAEVSPSENGYVCSKWVCEKIMQKAFALGVSGKVYRMGNITGCTRYGISNAEENHTLNLIKGCLQLGKGPAWAARLDISPVDVLADILVSESKSENYVNEFYNLGYVSSITWRELFGLFSNKGYAIDMVQAKVWAEHYVSTLKEDNALFQFKSFYDRETEDLDLHVENTLIGESKIQIDARRLFDLYSGYWRVTGFIK